MIETTTSHYRVLEKIGLGGLAHHNFLMICKVSL
jgi:hypothetical protein